MKRFKKVIIIGAIVFAIGATSVTAFAASAYKTPAEVVAGLTGKTVESVIAERQDTNKTYGAIASEAGKFNEFKKENIEMKKENIKLQVAEKTITQEKADSIIKAIEERQENCDGTGFEKNVQRGRAGFGSNGEGQGYGHARRGKGLGGMGFQGGACNAIDK